MDDFGGLKTSLEEVTEGCVRNSKRTRIKREAWSCD